MGCEYWIDDYEQAGVDKHLHDETRKKILDRVAVILPYVVDKNVISLGCGSGFSENEFKLLAKSVVGVDVDENAINYARYKYTGVDFFCHDAADVHPFLFPADSFDVAVSTEVMEHMSKSHAIKIIEVVKQILVKGGVFVGTVPVDDDVDLNEYHQVHYTHEELRKWLSEHFDDVEVSLLKHPHPEFFFGDSWLFKGVNR